MFRHFSPSLAGLGGFSWSTQTTFHLCSLSFLYRYYGFLKAVTALIGMFGGLISSTLAGLILNQVGSMQMCLLIVFTIDFGKKVSLPPSLSPLPAPHIHHKREDMPTTDELLYHLKKTSMNSEGPLTPQSILSLCRLVVNVGNSLLWKWVSGFNGECLATKTGFWLWVRVMEATSFIRKETKIGTAQS